MVVRFVDAGEKEVDQKISSHGYGKENDFYEIVMGEKLVPERVYRLFIKYTGRLSDSLNGYYFVSYEQDGETK